MQAQSQLLIGCRVATLAENGAPYGLIDDAAIAVVDGRVAWVGPAATYPKEYETLEKKTLDNRLVTPGLVDCHTHIVHGGDRAAEFELRLNGASYEEVARAGGGIISTVKATRAASVEALVEHALPRVDAMLAEGRRQLR